MPIVNQQETLLNQCQIMNKTSLIVQHTLWRHPSEEENLLYSAETLAQQF
jgi:hypothetical protein